MEGNLWGSRLGAYLSVTDGLHLIFDTSSLELLHYSNKSIFFNGKTIYCYPKLRSCSPITFLVNFMKIYDWICLFYVYKLIYKKEVEQNHRVLPVSGVRLRVEFWDVISSAPFVRGEHKIVHLLTQALFSCIISLSMKFSIWKFLVLPSKQGITFFFFSE